MQKLKWIKPFLLLSMLLWLAVYPAVAQEVLLDETDEDALFGGNEEDLFGGEEMVTVVDENTTGDNFDNILLNQEALDWGGDFSFSYTSSWSWEKAAEDTFLQFGDILDNFTTPSGSSVITLLGAKMYFDGRPAEDFRVLGKFEVIYPLDPTAVTELSEVLRITELFADYNWAERLFFRVGKHTIKWGVGYYFSPADILNLSPIDPDNPEAQREGPLSLKVNLPVNLHNFYLFMIANNIDKPGALAFAPKAELVIGNAELGIGGFIRPDMAIRPRLMATLTTGLGDFNLFGESVLSFGTEGRYLEESATTPGGLEVVTREDQLFFEGTAGFSYMYNNDDQTFNVMATGQYLYNGKGYPDLDLIDTYAATVNLLLFTQQISFIDLMRPARHYWALSFNLSQIGGSDFSLGGFWLASADGSGQVAPSVGWNPDSDLNISLRVPVFYGDAGSDFASAGPKLVPGLDVTLFEHTKLSLSAPLKFSKADDGAWLWQSGEISLGLSLAKGGF